MYKIPLTQVEIDSIVQDLKNGKYYNELCDKYQTSKSTLNRICKKFNIDYTPKSTRILDYDKILELAELGNSPYQIAKILNVNKISVNSMLNKQGKYFAPKHENIRLFNICDSHVKAYFLGFIAADGALVDNGNSSIVLTITIHRKDVHLLERLKYEFQSNIKIQRITTKMSHTDKNKDHVRLAISNKGLTEDLYQYGITPRKSLTMPNIIPNIPKEFRKSFILGYFDGDGSVMYQTQPKIKKNKTYLPHGLSIGIRGTKEFLQGIVDELGINHYTIRYDTTHYLFFSKKTEIVKFFDCYKNVDIFLPRKRDRFIERLSHPSWSKFIQVQTISLPELKV